jgi:hypothetical protein
MIPAMSMNHRTIVPVQRAPTMWLDWGRPYNFMGKLGPIYPSLARGPIYPISIALFFAKLNILAEPVSLLLFPSAPSDTILS